MHLKLSHIIICLHLKLQLKAYVKLTLQYIIIIAGSFVLRGSAVNQELKTCMIEQETAAIITRSRKGGRKEGREGGRDGGREGGREGGRKRGREGGGKLFF